MNHTLSKPIWFPGCGRALVSPRAGQEGFGRWLLLLLMLALDHTTSLAAGVQASLDRSTVPLGETVTLNLTIEGLELAGGLPEIPSVAGLSISPRGQSRQVTAVNGRRTIQFILTYVIEAQQTGDFTIPPIPVSTQSGVLRTRALSLKVVKESNVDLSNSPAFLRLVAQKEEVYLGEPLTVEIQLYIEAGQGVQLPQMAGDGFNFGKQLDPVRSNTRVGNREMALFTFRTVATPVKSGTLTLGPSTMVLDLPRPGSRPDFFGRYPSQRVKRATEALKIRVLSLPPGAPPEFTGAVGKYQMSYNAGPTTLTVGDPITLKIAIQGEGMIDGISLPKLDQWTGFKFYPANTRTEFADQLEVSGTRYFEQVVVPQNPELKSLPAFVWSYFDPEQKAYRTLKGAAVPLRINASVVSSAPAPTLATNATTGPSGEATTGLVHIRPQLGLVLSPAPPVWDRSWFLALQLLPVGVWAALRVHRARRESLARNPRLRRQREVAQAMVAGLRELRAQAAANQTDLFFSTLTRLLRAQIGQKLDLPDSGLTEAVIDERLVPRGLTGEAVAELHDLFRQSNQYRYAPQMGVAKLEGMIPRVERALESIRRLPDS